jgi:hypothetical protein
MKFFGTLEHKALFDSVATPEQVFISARDNLKLGSDWVMERSIAESKKAPSMGIVKWVGEKPVRQALPDSITSFIAIHVEKGHKIASQRIKCKGGENPDQQAELVSKSFSKPMEISEWQIEHSDGEVHLQCARLAFAPIRFMMNRKVVDSWRQVSANNKQRERLASVLFGERVSSKRQLFDAGHVLVYEMTPFAQRYVKPRADSYFTFSGETPRNG